MCDFIPFQPCIFVSPSRSSRKNRPKNQLKSKSGLPWQKTKYKKWKEGSLETCPRVPRPRARRRNATAVGRRPQAQRANRVGPGPLRSYLAAKEPGADLGKEGEADLEKEEGADRGKEVGGADQGKEGEADRGKEVEGADLGKEGGADRWKEGGADRGKEVEGADQGKEGGADREIGRGGVGVEARAGPNTSRPTTGSTGEEVGRERAGGTGAEAKVRTTRGTG